jgi:hypothetical protein
VGVSGNRCPSPRIPIGLALLLWPPGFRGRLVKHPEDEPEWPPAPQQSAARHWSSPIHQYITTKARSCQDLYCTHLLDALLCESGGTRTTTRFFAMILCIKEQSQIACLLWGIRGRRINREVVPTLCSQLASDRLPRSRRGSLRRRPATSASGGGHGLATRDPW